MIMSLFRSLNQVSAENSEACDTQPVFVSGVVCPRDALETYINSQYSPHNAHLETSGTTFSETSFDTNRLPSPP